MNKSGHYCMNCMKEKEGDGVCPGCGFDAGGYVPKPHHLPPETILYGKYLIGRVLGEGGFGITYKGWDLALEVMVAVKEYYPVGMVTRDSGVSNSITPFSGEYGERFRSGRNRFIREARSLAKFEALKEIVKVRDFFMENNTSYIVMEYLDGTPLNRYVEQSGGVLKPGQVLTMMKPVVKALGQVHGAGLIHRDISPDNLMVMEDQSLKLLDFGAVRDIAADGEARSRTLMLKLGYAPEEQYHSNGNQGPWTDVYALCATMYYCITGMVPPESLDRSQEDGLAPFGELGIKVEPNRAAALYKGLSVMAEDRFQSMEELYEALYGTELGRPDSGGGQQESVTDKEQDGAANGPRKGGTDGTGKERADGTGGPRDGGTDRPRDGRAGETQNHGKAVSSGGGRGSGTRRACAAILGVSALFLAVGFIFTSTKLFPPPYLWTVVCVLWAVTAAGFYHRLKGGSRQGESRQGESYPGGPMDYAAPSPWTEDETAVMHNEKNDIYYLEYQDGEKRRRVPLERERTVIGRLAQEVDIAVENKRVGKVHAQIIAKGGAFYVCDLDSKNGTYLNGSVRRIPANTLCPLHNGDRITLADSDFYLRKD